MTTEAVKPACQIQQTAARALLHGKAVGAKPPAAAGPQEHGANAAGALVAPVGAHVAAAAPGTGVRMTTKTITPVPTEAATDAIGTTADAIMDTKITASAIICTIITAPATSARN